MAKGYFSLVLNAHLPFVRHPEFPDFLEERWLFEAISESYLPLLRALKRLEADSVPFKVAISLSPTLQSMLGDPVLQKRYLEYLAKQIRFAEAEEERLRDSPESLALVSLYRELYETALTDITEQYQGNILSGFEYFQARGKVELLTSPGTNPFMPLYQEFPESVNAQIESAVITHRKSFSRAPDGVWLAQNGYYSALEHHLKDYNFTYTILDPRAFVDADPLPPNASFAPIVSPNGFCFFARDKESTDAVVDPHFGYPANPVYRDFYRDVGYDLPLERLSEFMIDPKARVPIGFKYNAIGSKTSAKPLYHPEQAQAQAMEHAKNYVYQRIQALKNAHQYMGKREPHILAAYDAELFGHWWFEGVSWLEAMLRSMAQESADIVMVNPSEYLSQFPPETVSQPELSSSAKEGYSVIWLESENAWLCRHLHKLAERMVELSNRFPNEQGLKERALNQAAREVLLSQASDWPYLMRNEPSGQFARRQIEDAITNFNNVYDMLSRNAVSTEWLTKLEKRNNLFPAINYRMFRSQR
jgi:1,4-alpha-glucan branching enzyme